MCYFAKLNKSPITIPDILCYSTNLSRSDFLFYCLPLHIDRVILFQKRIIVTKTISIYERIEFMILGRTCPERGVSLQLTVTENENTIEVPFNVRKLCITLSFCSKYII